MSGLQKCCNKIAGFATRPETNQIVLLGNMFVRATSIKLHMSEAIVHRVQRMINRKIEILSTPGAMFVSIVKKL